MKVVATALPGVLLVEPDVFGDARGYFLEAYHAGRYAAAGIPGPFVQDNLSYSAYGVLRGLHLQHPAGQGKLVSVVSGEVFDVAVDVRVGSPTFGRWTGAWLSGDNRRQLYVPPGYAHGFQVTSAGGAYFAYKCTAPYDAASELTVRWDDPRVGVEWPGEALVLSPKDAAAPRLDELPLGRLPAYAGPCAGPVPAAACP